MNVKPIDKHLNLLDFALSSLWRRKARHLSVLVVFAAVIFLLASFQMVHSALNRSARLMLASTPEITIQKLTAGRQESIPLIYAEKLQGIFGIRKPVPRVWGYSFDEARGANYTVIGVEKGAMPFTEALDEAVQDGRFFKDGESGAVVLGPGVQDALDLQGRKSFSLARPDHSRKGFSVVGAFGLDTAFLTYDLIAMDIDEARDLFGIDADHATDLLVTVANPTEITTIAKKIAALLPDTRVLTRPQIQKTYTVVFGWRSGLGVVCLLAALAAFSIFAWDKASGLSPEERREIAILKVLGWETADVLLLRFWEGLLVSVFAFVIGCTAAYLHVGFLGARLFWPVLAGWSVIRPPYAFVPEVAVADFLLLASFSVLPYLAVTVIPVWRAAITPPDAAIN